MSNELEVTAKGACYFVLLNYTTIMDEHETIPIFHSQSIDEIAYFISSFFGTPLLSSEVWVGKVFKIKTRNPKRPFDHIEKVAKGNLDYREMAKRAQERFKRITNG